MSVYSNQGPLKRVSHSESQASLYSDHSQHSDSPIQNQQRSNVKPIQPTITINKSIPKIQEKQPINDSRKSNSKLPEIKAVPTKNASEKINKIFNNSFVNDAAERHALFNQKFSSIEINEEKISRPNILFSKSQNKDQKMLKRYGYSEVIDEDGRQGNRALGSSQASRWVRSQSLAVSRTQKSFKHLVRHYHRHNSIMIEALNKFCQLFEAAERFISSNTFKLSLFDSLQNMKLKMEAYLERHINLTNFQTNKPLVDWSQEQFMNFYSNYRKIMIAEERKEQHQPYTLKKYKNCVFFGRMNEGKKQEGVLHYFSGKCFEGRFRQDQKQYGLQIDDQQLYLGDFKKGLRHGDGVLKTSESLYVGTFTYGEFSTFAQPKEEGASSSLFVNHPIEPVQNKRGFEISHSSIKIFEGGLCIMKNNAGDIYIGNLKQNDEKHQEGLQIFANGDIYIGRYESDSPQGYGQYYWENGSNYRGQFLSGMRHGRGVWQMVNGDFYQGEYMNDKKNGKGTYKWKNGSRYVGNFENDYRHGYGEMYWQDGRVYKGKWLNGIEKNTIITLQQPQAKPKIAVKMQRPSFRTIQHDSANRKKMPLQKLKSLYNPSYN